MDYVNLTTIRLGKKGDAPAFEQHMLDDVFKRHLFKSTRATSGENHALLRGPDFRTYLWLATVHLMVGEADDPFPADTVITPAADAVDPRFGRAKRIGVYRPLGAGD